MSFNKLRCNRNMKKINNKWIKNNDWWRHSWKDAEVGAVRPAEDRKKKVQTNDVAIICCWEESRCLFNIFRYMFFFKLK